MSGLPESLVGCFVGDPEPAPGFLGDDGGGPLDLKLPVDLFVSAPPPRPTEMIILPASVISVFSLPEMIGLALAGLLIAVAGALAPASWAARSHSSARRPRRSFACARKLFRAIAAPSTSASDAHRAYRWPPFQCRRHN